MGTKREPAVKKGLIKILKDGPYEVSGGVPLDKAVVVSGADGIPARWKKGARLHPKDKPYHLCRCGHSANKPYCDGTHHKIKFSGKETAPAKTYAELAVKYEGPGLILSDAESLCSVGLFCHRAGDAWTLTEKSGNRKARATAIREACDCPSGRLVAIDKRTGKTIEPKLKPGISLVEDPERRASGPLWVKGGIKIKSSKGRAYETRNRVTLCRCGRSVNKPFCDGSHMPFKDGDKSVE